MNTLRAPSKIFRFKGCLNAPKLPCTRRYARLATAFAERPVTASPGATADADLRAVFDDRAIGGTATSTSSMLNPTGLFGYSEMSSPSAIVALGERTLTRARHLVSRAKRAKSSRTEMEQFVKTMDRLSDMLCGVIDMCELVRYAHPDPQFAGAANHVYEYLCSYMNILNTDVELYEVLKLFLSDNEIKSSRSYEEQQVARLFLYDFEKSGIHLPKAQRQRCVELSDEILVLGRQFLSEAATPRPSYDMPTELLEDMPPSQRQEIVSRASSRWNRRVARITPHSWAHQAIAKYAPNDEARRIGYVAANSSTPEQVNTLERLLQARSELAKLVGSGSFAEMTLGNSMAKRPEYVMEFLRTLSEHHRPSAFADVQRLVKAKQEHLALSTPPILQPWDRDFYTLRLPIQSIQTPLSPFFSLGTVMQGLSRLFSHLYGITLHPASLAAGEAWHPDVRKLEVVDEDEGTVGWVYVDAWAREGKAPGAAHYTVRCSRRVDFDDIRGDVEAADFSAESGLPLQVPSVRVRGRAGRHQLPIIVLMCDVSPPAAGRPSLLTWHEVETIFHEMGHAIHSMIGRTDYHNVAGTRCATDFVELPSILMEHLAASPAVVGLFARHYQTDLPLPYSQLQKHITANRTFEALNSQHQIMLAALDQVLHSPRAAESGFSSTEEWARLHGTMGAMPYAEGTSWQTQFGHLYSYGATYYSYLFDRAIASRVFEQVFGGGKEGRENRVVSREAGEKFKKGVLRWGGGKDPWEMVGEVLSDEEVFGGGAAAMRAVGKWGIAPEAGQY